MRVSDIREGAGCRHGPVRSAWEASTAFSHFFSMCRLAISLVFGFTESAYVGEGLVPGIAAHLFSRSLYKGFSRLRSRSAGPVLAASAISSHGFGEGLMRRRLLNGKSRVR